MTERVVDVTIIGAGTAGLTALKEVQKITENFLLINDGPYGTTCARVGCMPSKVLIQIADDYFRRHEFEKQGIVGKSSLSLNPPAVMSHVRELRDRFIIGPIRSAAELGEKNIFGHAVFIEPNLLRVGDLTIRTRATIIATGSRPLIPEAWREFGSRILTSDTLFELTELPKSVAVIGLGAIGLELGQALSRLEVKVTGFSHGHRIAGLEDPEVNRAAIENFTKEFEIFLGEDVTLENLHAKSHGESNDGIRVRTKNHSVIVDSVIASLGRTPNFDNLHLVQAGVPQGTKFDPQTMQLGKFPIFIAGDVTHDRPVLHEASDEGRIAGFNCLREKPQAFARRTPLEITFTDPNLAAIGEKLSQLKDRDIVIGEVDFSDQGRARIMGQNKGKLRIYADKQSGVLLGAALACPGGEHLAHYLALLVQKKITVNEALSFPIYHPVLHEGLRTALRDAAKKSDGPRGDLETPSATPYLEIRPRP